MTTASTALPVAPAADAGAGATTDAPHRSAPADFQQRRRVTEWRAGWRHPGRCPASTNGIGASPAGSHFVPATNPTRRSSPRVNTQADEGAVTIVRRFDTAS